MGSKELLAKLYVKIDQISALAIKNSFMPSEIAKDVDFIGNTLNQIEKELEELGIELSVLFKAMKNGIYTNKYPAHMKVPTLRIVDGEWCFVKAGTEVPRTFNVKLKDYKKTWALTKEELEK